MASRGKDSVVMRGLVFGKFFPPHVGHQYLIDVASAECSELFIVVCASEGAEPTGHKRAFWIQQLAPHAEVLLTDDLCAWHFGSPCVDSCTEMWTKWTLQNIPGKIDLVFSSEAYGEKFAHSIGATSRCVDENRSRFPVSATDVRSNYQGLWNQLPTVVRSGLFRKLVVMGVESSGTTTLASDLAAAIKAPWVAEVGRTKSWELSIRHAGIENAPWDEKVFWEILREQAQAETEAKVRWSDNHPGPLGPWLVCDTDAIATVVWWERYLASPSDDAWKFAIADLGDLYVITDPSDVDFYQDGIRDGEHLRTSMHEKFLEIARRTNRTFLLASGSRETRVQQVLHAMRCFDIDYPRFQISKNQSF